MIWQMMKLENVTLIELSTSQWKRYGHNSIIVNGIHEQKLSKSNTHLKYSNVSVGNNCASKKRYAPAKVRQFNGKVLPYRILVVVFAL